MSARAPTDAVAPAGARPLPLAGLLTIAAAITGGLGLWLLAVCATVLPSRDAAHEPLWLGAAIACLAWSGLAFARVRRGSRRGLLAASVLALSLAALAFGFGALVAAVRRTEFEGYLVVIALVLVAHAIVSIASLALGARSAAAR